MAMKSHHQIVRRVSRAIKVGRVTVGGGAPVSVQTMTNTDTEDVAATVAQVPNVASMIPIIATTGTSWNVAQITPSAVMVIELRTWKRRSPLRSAPRWVAPSPSAQRTWPCRVRPGLGPGRGLLQLQEEDRTDECR